MRITASLLTSSCCCAISPVQLLLLLLCFFFVAYPFAAVAVTNQQDANALIDLHRAWSFIPSWDTSTDPCDHGWIGVGCDTTNTRVVELILINRHLNGTLSAAIGNLTNLIDLDLSSNPNLGGSLPPEIGKLSNLFKFFAQFCNFSGTIPSEIGGMTNLQYLGLTRNSLTGPIPPSIGLLTKMFWLDLSSNFLNGSLPVSASSGNGLDNLINAGHFHLQNNSLSESIPSTLFNTQMQLLHLLLHDNSFNGSIPLTFGDLINVKIVRFDFNNLSGSIPPNVSAMQNLTTLHLENNALTGQLPDFSNNKKLQMLVLGNNQFEASQIPAWITDLSNLCLLSLQSANLNGSIPSELFALPRISNVTLGSNNLGGTLNLTAASSTLLIVNVTNNNIAALDRGTYVHDLLLDGNTYCDTNPTVCTDVQSATSLAPLSLVAPALLTCTNECPAQYATNRKVPGNCQCARPVVGTVTFVASEIPILTAYNSTLIEQQLIEKGLNKYKYLSAENLTFDESQVVVDVLSSNQIIVSVFPPSGTPGWSSNDAARIAYVLKSQDVQFTDIGPLTCEFNGPQYDGIVVVENALGTGAKIGIAVGVVAFVVVVVLVAVYAVKQKKRAENAEKQTKPFAAWIAASERENPDIPQSKGARWFSFAEIKKCTNNFSQNNEIGEGGYGKVYKGFLQSGEGVAIKRAKADSMEGAMEFKNKVELLSRVHHRNLVGLIGFCFEEGEQMLVFEYMLNGTLKDCLSGQSGIRMDWEKRIGIALGSAKGIAYLHSEANPPIIHRNIKSSNILLDKKLIPKVADFGLSNDGGTAHWSTEFKGTPGYLDPDYFLTQQLTEKSDVYSFGVILLELITGRQPIQEGKNMVREVEMAVEQGGMASVMQSMVDPNLTEYPTKAMERLVEISLRCIQGKSKSRPRMGDLVYELEPLAPQEESSVAAMNIDTGEVRSELYAAGSAFMSALPSSSFEYSGWKPTHDSSKSKWRLNSRD